MLAQEDLGEMGLNSPSEQVAYLLVERATLLERLEAAERRLESQSLTGNLSEVHHQVKYCASRTSDDCSVLHKKGTTQIHLKCING